MSSFHSYNVCFLHSGSPRQLPSSSDLGICSVTILWLCHLNMQLLVPCSREKRETCRACTYFCLYLVVHNAMGDVCPGGGGWKRNLVNTENYHCHAVMHSLHFPSLDFTSFSVACSCLQMGLIGFMLWHLQYILNIAARLIL